MKKLNLKLEGIGEMLTKDQMKRVLGGDYGGGGGYGDLCKTECVSNSDCDNTNGYPYCNTAYCPDGTTFYVCTTAP